MRADESVRRQLVGVLGFAAIAVSAGPSLSATGISCEKRNIEGASYRFCSINPKLVQLRLDWLAPDSQAIGGIQSLNAVDSTRGLRVLFAMNAGMFANDGRNTPIGLYIGSDGFRTPLNRRDSTTGNFYDKPNGVFFISDGIAHVVDAVEFDEQRWKPSLATQSGPMLVKHRQFPHGGLYIPESIHTASRNGIGVTGEGVVVCVYSETEVTMDAFRRALRDGFDLEDAIYLDGTVSRFYTRGDHPPSGVLGPMLSVVEAMPPR